MIINRIIIKNSSSRISILKLLIAKCLVTVENVYSILTLDCSSMIGADLTNV